MSLLHFLMFPFVLSFNLFLHYSLRIFLLFEYCQNSLSVISHVHDTLFRPVYRPDVILFENCPEIEQDGELYGFAHAQSDIALLQLD